MTDITWNYHSNTKPSKKGEPSKYNQNYISVEFYGVKYTQKKKQEFHMGCSDQEMAVTND